MRAYTKGKNEMGKRFAIVASATRGRSATWLSSIALGVMVLGAVWLAAAPQAAEARGPTACSHSLVTHNVSCNYAKRVASHHIKTGDRRFNGWKCDDDKHGEGVDTTCHRYRKGGKQRIDYSLKRLGARHAALGAQTATSSTREPGDSVKPDLQLSGVGGTHELKKQSLDDAVLVKASCSDEACTARAEGKLTKVKNDKLKPASADLVPGEKTKLELGLTPKTRRQAHEALDKGKNVQAKVTVEATDAAGNVATAKRTIKIVQHGPGACVRNGHRPHSCHSSAAQAALAGEDPVDSIAPDLQLSGKKKQSQVNIENGSLQPGPVWLSASCGEASGPPTSPLEESDPPANLPDLGCHLSAEGKLTKVKNGTLRPGLQARVDLPGPHVLCYPCHWHSGSSALMELDLGRKTRDQVRKVLLDGKMVKAKVTVRAKYASGKVETAKRTIKLVK